MMAMATAIALSAAPVARADAGSYLQQNLVSNQAGVAPNLDTKLLNAWGIVFNPTGPVWVSANGSGFSTLYNGAGLPQALVVVIPPASGQDSGNPTGIVFNGNANAFKIPTPTAADPSATAAARFLWVTEDGVLAAWNTVGPDPGASPAILVHDNSTLPSPPVYKGLALSANGDGARLYATDFHNNKIDVWDGNFNPVTPPGGFTDPNLPSGFAPFGIQAINGNLYITYAMQDADAHDDVPGKGLGYVDVFDPNGNLLDRFASKGNLNSPWGLALAPAGFGKFSGNLLVGNFGDGHINAFDLATGNPRGEFKDMNGKTLAIDGLWGIAFGNGYQGQPVNTLFFTAGPNGEADGLYGRLDPVPGNDNGKGNGHGHGNGHD
jgi:uncharacterized protein (TIGR03118 family)